MRQQSYQREIPRDLFNEANLLKCLAKLSLIALNRGRPEVLRVIMRPGHFDVRQDEADGSIYCENVQIVLRERLFDHRRPLNSREPWPLWLRPAFEHPYDADWPSDDFEAFDDEGNLSADLFRLLEWGQ